MRMGPSRLLTVLRSGGRVPITYVYRDEFTTDRAAGAINGTACEPGPGTRFMSDPNSRATISGGWLRFLSGVGWDPSYAITPALSRKAGQMFCTKIRSIANLFGLYGWDTNTSVLPTECFYLSGGVQAYTTGGRQVSSGATGPFELNLVVIQRTAGAHYFIQTEDDYSIGYPEPTLVWTDHVATAASNYPRLQGEAAGANKMMYKYVRVPENLWLPTPVVSDGFSSWGTSDGLGHAEGVAGGDALGQGGDGAAWASTVGTWGAAAGVASCSALDGGIGVATVAAAADVNLEVDLSRAGGECGLIARYADANNFIYVVYDGTNVVLRKVIAGAESDLATAAATGSHIRLYVQGSEVRVYDDVTLKTTQTVSDAAVQSSTTCGLYTTNTGNTFDNFTAWSRT
jgi:hypothetical protein